MFSPPKRMSPTLNALKSGQHARILELVADASLTPLPKDALLRLEELGFLPGEEVQLLRRGPGGDPLACRIGHALFALRRIEASAILVEDIHG